MTSPYAPTIGSTGILAPTFAQILAQITSDYQGIFGADTYLGNDSQDGQFIAILARALSDCGAAAVGAYNARSPATAVGVGLSADVKINGLARLVPSNSTAPGSIAGIAGITITNGQAADVNGILWNLPASVTIPSSGVALVTLTCATTGATTAASGTITTIQTPVYGWQSITNTAAATPGNPVESDAALRVRQANSVALPSLTVFDGIVASIQTVAGVTRVAGYENNTNAADVNGVPSKNLAFVVEGGTSAAIIAAIGAKLPPGIPTFGTTSGQFTSSAGTIKTIAYTVSGETVISVALTIKSGSGWSTSVETVIAQAIVNYILALPIGQPVSFTELYIPAYAALAQFPGAYKITGMTVNGGTADIAIAYNAAPTSVVADVTFTVS